MKRDRWAQHRARLRRFRSLTVRERSSWNNMRQRCLNQRHPAYPDYGGRGITVCKRWLGPNGFIAFLADMGARPIGKSLDRRDVDGNYEPDNCRWATPLEQMRNRRDNRVTLATAAEIRRRHAAGESTRALAAEFGMSPTTAWRVATGRRWAS